jgi:ATP-dependent DNA helicase RecG
MLNSRTPCWEDLSASPLLSAEEILRQLDTATLLELIERPVPADSTNLLQWLAEEKLIKFADHEKGYITNLGAVAAGQRLADFQDLSRKAVRVIVYDGVNKATTKREMEGGRGFAIRFQRPLESVSSLLPQSEVIERALRVSRTVYPAIALREIIANALIHQDFSIRGAGPLVEIFDDRIEISNPGSLLPSKRLDRLIGTQPESRNERLASDHKCLRLRDLCKELEISSAHAYCSGAGAASQDRRLFGAFVPVS